MTEESKPLLNNDDVSDQKISDADSPSSSVVETNTNDVPNENPDFVVPEPGPANSTSKITCRVCQEMIDVMGKLDQHVVKCNRCNEATPIMSAPPGKKYVRCLCHCLLICKSSSQRIACPRTNCKRVINLAPSPVTPAVPQVLGMCRVTCVHCQDTFLFNMLQNALARCPHCRKVSSVGPEFAKAKGIFFFVVAIILFLVGGGITYFTYSYAINHIGYFSIHMVILMLTLIALWKCLYYCRIKVSSIDGPV
ncbi:Phosphatidylinositol 4,5-bisphosphate 4-phosphatase [Cinara cedri]|uniref:Phosphatidylinositol-4,5-bisphosphate 4-phosphatase n=1 Tax=Cinara cedri TaxID=506608 RepID=A0A5E4N4V9_9HEMI|nr:Phosphatidylinositol 4,5-bisphosphate 4-phosphatase [Cinara cedri]